MGQDYTAEGNINDLDDLKYVDGKAYEIQDSWNIDEDSIPNSIRINVPGL